MKRKLLTVYFLLMTAFSFAQNWDTTTVVYDFNSYSGNLNGQDSWVTTKFNTNNDISVSNVSTFDGTNALTQTAAGANVGVTGNRTLSTLFSGTKFSDPNAIYVIKADIKKNYWNLIVFLGADLNSDGKMFWNNSAECAIRFQNSQVTPAGTFVSLAGSITTDTIVTSTQWTRITIVLRNMGTGGYADLYANELGTGVTNSKLNIPLGVNYSASNNTNPNLWNMVGLHFETANGWVDNLTFQKIVDLTSVNELNAKNDFAMYPNPATDYMQIVVEPKLQNATYRIIDLAGREVKKGILESTTTMVSLDGLEAGSYSIGVEGCGLKTFIVSK